MGAQLGLGKPLESQDWSLGAPMLSPNPCVSLQLSRSPTSYPWVPW